MFSKQQPKPSGLSQDGKARVVDMKKAARRKPQMAMPRPLPDEEETKPRVRPLPKMSMPRPPPSSAHDDGESYVAMAAPRAPVGAFNLPVRGAPASGDKSELPMPGTADWPTTDKDRQAKLSGLRKAEKQRRAAYENSISAFEKTHQAWVVGGESKELSDYEMIMRQLVDNGVGQNEWQAVEHMRDGEWEKAAECMARVRDGMVSALGPRAGTVVCDTMNLLMREVEAREHENDACMVDFVKYLNGDE